MTAVKIVMYISQHAKFKSHGCFNQGSGNGKPMQLMFVNHMSNLTKFYCSLSFARQYIK